MNENLLTSLGEELYGGSKIMDMAINLKKKLWCIRIDPRCDKTIGTHNSETGHSKLILWVTEMCY